MAGRPSGLTSLVPVNDVINTAQIRNEENWRLATLLPNLIDNESAIKWCSKKATI